MKTCSTCKHFEPYAFPYAWKGICAFVFPRSLTDIILDRFQRADDTCDLHKEKDE